MKFSTQKWKLQNEVKEVCDECMQSQPDRQGFYRQMRQLYLSGQIEPSLGRVNKIRPILERLSSFMFSPGGVQFWFNIPPADLNPVSAARIDPALEALKEKWDETGLDLQFAEATDWALAFGTMHIYQAPERMRDGTKTLVSYLVDPGSMGVFSEAQPDLSKQEAVCMETFWSKHELRRMIDTNEFSETEKVKIINSVEVGQLTTRSLGRVFVSNLSSSPGAQGFAPANWANSFQYEPSTNVEQCRILELYCYDDKLGDYRVFTLSGGYLIREMPISKCNLEHRFPFTKVCPMPLKDFYWGFSLANALQQLQKWYQERLDQTDELLKKALNPPKVGIMVGGLQEERFNALDRPGGKVISNQPGSSINQLDIKIPPEALELFPMIDDLLADEANMRPAQFGRQENATKARTEGIFSNIIRIGAAPVRRRALIIERAISEAANQLWQLMREYSVDWLPDEEHQDWFVANEFPETARVIVDGHSASPLFQEDHAALAEILIRAGAIDQETLIDLLHPPMQQMMQRRLKKIQMAKQIAAQMQMRLQEAKRSGHMQAAIKQAA